MQNDGFLKCFKQTYVCEQIFFSESKVVVMNEFQFFFAFFWGTKKSKLAGSDVQRVSPQKKSIALSTAICCQDPPLPSIRNSSKVGATIKSRKT